MESKDQIDVEEESESCASSTAATLEYDDVTSRAIAEGHKTKGDEEFRKQEYSSAIDFYTKGLQVKCKDEEFNAKLYSGRATSHFLLENYNEALSDVKSTRDLQPSNLQAIIIGARACNALNQFEEAIKWCDEGFKIDPGQNILVELRKSIHRQLKGLKIDRCAMDKTETDTVMEKGSGQPVASPVEFLPLNLDITKKVGNRKIEGEWFLKLAEDSFETGNFQEAIQSFDQYGRICKELKDRAGEGSAYGKLGDTYNSVGNVDEALDFFHKQLKIATEVGDKKSEGRVCATLGSRYYDLRKFRKAYEYCQKGGYCFIESGDKAGKGHVYGILGMIEHAVGNFSKAMVDLELSLTSAKELGDRVGEGTVYGNLGHVHRSFGNFKQAIEYHEMQLSIAEEQNSEIDKVRAYYDKGCNLESLGFIKEALACYKSCASLCNNIRARFRFRKENPFTDEWKINLFDEFYHVDIALCRTLLKLDSVLEALWVIEQGRAQTLAHLIQSCYGFRLTNLNKKKQY